jgi:hypothetical protein
LQFLAIQASANSIQLRVSIFTAHMHAQFDEATFATAWDEAAAMMLEQAIARRSAMNN